MSTASTASTAPTTGPTAASVPGTRARSSKTSTIRALHLVPAEPSIAEHRCDGAPRGPGIGQDQLPLEFCLPNGLPAIPRVPMVTANEPPSSVAPWAGRLAQAVLEVVAAERPVMQLTRWVVPEVYRRLERRHQAKARDLGGGAARIRCAELVRSVHVCHPQPDVAEVSVVTGGPDRCRAMAMRLERRRDRWLCTALDWA